MESSTEGRKYFLQTDSKGMRKDEYREAKGENPATKGERVEVLTRKSENLQ